MTSMSEGIHIGPVILTEVYFVTYVIEVCFVFGVVFNLCSNFIHSLVFSLRGRVGRNQSPVM